MPKIIFRPNPVPPPFVPPTPSYDTEIHATFNPLYFTPDNPPTVVFSPANLPDYFQWNILDESESPVIYYNEPGMIEPGKEYHTSTEVDYVSDTDYHLALYNEQSELIYRCKIIIDNA